MSVDFFHFGHAFCFLKLNRSELLMRDYMRISEAIELARQSMDPLMARIDQLDIKELFELVNDLRFSNNPEVFTSCHNVLIKKLLIFLEEMEELEKNSEPRWLDILRHFTHEKIGIRTSPDTAPNIALRKHLDKIRNWTI